LFENVFSSTEKRFLRSVSYRLESGKRRSRRQERKHTFDFFPHDANAPKSPRDGRVSDGNPYDWHALLRRSTVDIIAYNNTIRTLLRVTNIARERIITQNVYYARVARRPRRSRLRRPKPLRDRVSTYSAPRTPARAISRRTTEYTIFIYVRVRLRIHFIILFRHTCKYRYDVVVVCIQTKIRVYRRKKRIPI